MRAASCAVRLTPEQGAGRDPKVRARVPVRRMDVCTRGNPPLVMRRIPCMSIARIILLLVFVTLLVSTLAACGGKGGGGY